MEEDQSPPHERPDMSLLPTRQEASLINLWLHEDPQWYVAGQLPLTEQEARWLVTYISYTHAPFHLQAVEVGPGTQPERKYQVALSCPSHDSTQPPMQVIVQSLEDYTNLLRWAAGRNGCFEKETEALSPTQYNCEEQRVFTFRRMIYTMLGLFLSDPQKGI